MNLNALERKFFDKILNAELGVPVHATLEYQKEPFPVIIVPEIDPDGYFRLKYYNAPAYDPETQYGDDGKPFKEWFGNEVSGTHPRLERAWLNRDQVTVQLHPSLSLPPTRPQLNPKLYAKVLYAEQRHRGLLALDMNQAILQKVPLKKAEFCILDFHDFRDT